MKSIFIIFFISLSFCAMSQHKEYAAGYYINQKSDTINGYFNKGRAKNFSEIKYKKSIEDVKTTTILLDSCKEFHMKTETYVMWKGKRSMTYLDKFKYTLMHLDSFKTENIPLRLLYKGNLLSLYSYTDDTDHFFIEFNDSIQELIISYRYFTDSEKRKTYIVNSPTYEIIPIYRAQLIALLNKHLTNKQKFRIEACGFDKSSFISLFKKIDSPANK